MKTFSIVQNKFLNVAAWIVGLIALWQLVAIYMRNIAHDPMAEKKLPLLIDVITAFQSNGANLLYQASVTFGYAGLGFLIGGTAGIILAIFMKLSPAVEKISMPYLLVSQMIPILGLAPIIFGLFKDVSVSRVVIAAYITFFPVAISFLGGMKSVDESLKMMMESFGANRRQMYQKLYIPYARANLFIGLKISAPMAVTASILVDTLSSQNGIGYLIISALYGGGTVGIFWPSVLLASIMGLIGYGIITILERLIMRKG